jgi:hypothetical protein
MSENMHMLRSGVGCQSRLLSVRFSLVLLFAEVPQSIGFGQ